MISVSVVATYEQLVEQSRAGASADPSWLGSEEHRILLQASLRPLFSLDDVRVEWAPSGEGTHWEHATRTIRFQRETPPGDDVPPADAAELRFALLLVHEGLHALYSIPAPAYLAARERLEAPNRNQAEELFQRLEDGRLRIVGVQNHPDLRGPIEKHARLATMTMVVLEPHLGSTESPTSLPGQFFLALRVSAPVRD